MHGSLPYVPSKKPVHRLAEKPRVAASASSCHGHGNLPSGQSSTTIRITATRARVSATVTMICWVTTLARQYCGRFKSSDSVACWLRSDALRCELSAKASIRDERHDRVDKRNDHSRKQGQRESFIDARATNHCYDFYIFPHPDDSASTDCISRCAASVNEALRPALSGFPTFIDEVYPVER